MISNLIKLFKSEILDKYIRDNFQRLEDYLRTEPFGLGRFKFVEYTVAAGTSTPPHSLGFKPKDVIQLSVTPDDTAIVWNTDSFTREALSITAFQACTVRAYVGRYGDTL